LILAVIGEQFGDSFSDEICGVVLSNRKKKNAIQLWIASNKNSVWKEKLAEFAKFPTKIYFHTHESKYATKPTTAKQQENSHANNAPNPISAEILNGEQHQNGHKKTTTKKKKETENLSSQEHSPVQPNPTTPSNKKEEILPTLVERKKNIQQESKQTEIPSPTTKIAVNTQHLKIDANLKDSLCDPAILIVIILGVIAVSIFNFFIFLFFKKKKKTKKN